MYRNCIASFRHINHFATFKFPSVSSVEGTVQFVFASLMVMWNNPFKIE